MELKIKTQTIINILIVLTWIIFTGLCINAGGYITNTIYTLFINSAGAEYFWNKLDLLNLYSYSESYFVSFTVVLCIVTVLKAILFYVIIKTLSDKQITQPFSDKVGKLISLSAYITFAIGLFSVWGTGLYASFDELKISLPPFYKLDFSGGDVWFFMSISLFVIFQVYKRAIEIQNEIDLTI